MPEIHNLQLSTSCYKKLRVQGQLPSTHYFLKNTKMNSWRALLGRRISIERRKHRRYG